MKIVLLENVKKLGKKDEIVEVSDGYARNMIIPKKLGLPATAENLNNLKLKNKNEEKKEENLKRIANEQKIIVEKTSFLLKIKAGANGKTFGSITNKEIAESINEICKIDIDKKNILLDEPIKNIGNYGIKVRLHRDIIATANIIIMEE